jgi:hypothetical protein
LRTVTVSEVLGEAWALYRLLWRRSILTAAAIFVFLSLIEALITRPGIGRNASLVLLLGSTTISVVGSLWVQGALVEVVRDIHEGRKPASIEQLYDTTRGQLWRLAAGGVLTGVGVGIGVLLLVIPGLVLLTRWSLLVPVIVVEGRPLREAFERSTRLVRGHGWPVFGVIVSTVLVSFVIAGVAQAVFLFLPAFFTVWIGGFVAASVATPFVAHAYTVMYYRVTEPGRRVIPGS